MTQEQTTAKTAQILTQNRLANSHYALLGLHPSASPIEVRRAYRKLSKCYHPDTTKLPQAIATAKFQQLNEAYATLSNPERRTLYDLKIGYSRINVIQAPQNLEQSGSSCDLKSYSAYLDPTDRPLSAGEVFVLFILGVTFLGCLVLVIVIGITRGDTVQIQEQLSSSFAQSIYQLASNLDIAKLGTE